MPYVGIEYAGLVLALYQQQQVEPHPAGSLRDIIGVLSGGQSR